MLMLVLTTQFNDVKTTEVHLVDTIIDRFNCSRSTIEVAHRDQTICTTCYSEQSAFLRMVCCILHAIYQLDHCLSINFLGFYLGLANRQIVNIHTFSHGCSRESSIFMQHVINFSSLTAYKSSVNYS